jgi:hypothetical protein
MFVLRDAFIGSSAALLDREQFQIAIGDALNAVGRARAFARMLCGAGLPKRRFAQRVPSLGRRTNLASSSDGGAASQGCAVGSTAKHGERVQAVGIQSGR